MGVVPFEHRYAVIDHKNPREIVLLRGKGCQWRRCRFCDYHLDFSADQEENTALNRRVLSLVTGVYRHLEVINSGSFTDLSQETMEDIKVLCRDKEIQTLHFECHWMHREAVSALRRFFSEQGIAVKVKIGVETFDPLFRESYLDKGIDEDNPERIAAYFDEVCLLQGIPGQTEQSMTADIETGLHYFERVCVNLMTDNTKPIRADKKVIQGFLDRVYPRYRDNDRVDILLSNTDFGVGVS